jgi:hypothetical protein
MNIFKRMLLEIKHFILYAKSEIKRDEKSRDDFDIASQERDKKDGWGQI